MTTATRASKPHLLDASDPAPPRPRYFNAPFGLFGRRKIKAMAGRKLIRSGPAIRRRPVPAGEPRSAARQGGLSRAREFSAGTRAAGEGASRQLRRRAHALTGDGAVLEKGIVYVAPLTERLELLPSISGAANPKSSTGRLDIFTR